MRGWVQETTLLVTRKGREGEVGLQRGSEGVHKGIKNPLDSPPVTIEYILWSVTLACPLGEI